MAAADADWLRQGMAAAKSGDIARVRLAMTSIGNPIARKIVLWAAIESIPDHFSFFELDQARRDLWGWPQKNGRQLAAERQLQTSGFSPQQTIDWFQGAEPLSPDGAMALAAAYQTVGRTGDAQNLIRRFWREKAFEADAQRTMLARFGSFLTVEDHIRRADTLLFGPQGPAARDMVALLPPDQQALANARLALRADARDASALVAAVPPALAHDPGLAVERARYLLQHDDGAAALALLPDFPTAPGEDGAARIWGVRRQLVNVAIQAGDYRAAYMAVDKHGLKPGPEAADAEFLAGWIALEHLHDAALADEHFANLQGIGSSPITQSRALYWRGRAREAIGDQAGAKTAYEGAARFNTAFYGQLAAAKAGYNEIILAKDPTFSAADRARFDGREIVQAARILGDAGQQSGFNSLVMAAADTLPNAEECALLVDLARAYGEQDLSMRVVRLAAQRGFILPERGYPLRGPPASASVDPAMVLGIVRQESGFDPHVRSGVGARGMMQLMPTTAKIVARRAGVSYSPARLDDADYNMALGTTFLGELVNQFDGSYLMAAAAYNAGPGRPTKWVATCGDPRGSSTDPVDYIECIPISETRNYVMRVLEGMQVYRARLNGGRAPLTLAADLKRGGYGGSSQTYAQTGPTVDSLLEGSLGSGVGSEAAAVVASTPVPNPPEVEHAPPKLQRLLKSDDHVRPVRGKHGAKGPAEPERKGKGKSQGKAKAKGMGRSKAAAPSHHAPAKGKSAKPRHKAK
jgi:soluble lytic murein transglycosylase